MSLRTTFKSVEKLAVDNAPTLISALAVTGTLTTAFLTGKATFKAAEIIRQRKEEIELFEDAVKPEFGKKEQALLVWKEYIPPAAAVVVTVACIVTANSISASRLAGMAAAYKLSEKQYEEYKDKVKEKLGIQDEKRMRDELHEEQVRKNPPTSSDWMHFSEDEVLFREHWTGRYFRSKMHIIKAAMNEINATLVKDQYATLSDFYELIGLERTQESSEIGWSLENHMDLDFTTTLYEDNRPIIVMEYSNLPIAIRDYHPLYRRGKGSEEYIGIH